MPNECEFSIKAMWKSLVWFYSHPYFTRVWAIQEINVNKERVLHYNLKKVLWDRVNIVAYYIIIETIFLEAFGFINIYYWWAVTTTIDLM